MTRIRKQTYTMRMFMDYMNDKDIRDDADVQRSGGQWTKEQMNELVATVLKGGYMPPIFIGEDLQLQKWLIDGQQRSTSLKMYRYGHYKISSAIRNPVIRYRTKLKDENGSIVGRNGDIVWKDAEFDIRNKTYRELPEELQKRFDSFQVDTVIFEECTMEQMSELIQIYNNHTPMNTTQRAFTYISNYAGDVREIAAYPFFIDYSNYTEKEKIKGITERVVLESVMCMFHLKNWKKQVKRIGIYLNSHSSREEFQRLADNLCRLERVITDESKDIFDSKNSFLFLALFDRFRKLGLEEERFGGFLIEFKRSYRNERVNGEGMLFDEIDKDKGTKDKTAVIAKLDMLEKLMGEFLKKEAG